MEPWHLAHLIALGLWGGLVAGEAVVELKSRSDEECRQAAKLHYWMDIILDLPLPAAVVLTGAVLAMQARPLSPLHWAKIGAGLVAVSANLWCVAHVVTRYRRSEDVETLRRHGQWVRVTASV